MVYPIDARPVSPIPDGLTLLDFIAADDDGEGAADSGHSTDGPDDLAFFLQSLDTVGAMQPERDPGEVERCEIEAAILADRLFPQERLPSVVVGTGATTALAETAPSLPIVLKRRERQVAPQWPMRPIWKQLLALALVMSGSGLFLHAQTMRERDRRLEPAVATQGQVAHRPRVVVEVVATRLADVTGAGQIATVRAQDEGEAAERVTHDPAVPVGRILAVAERFVSEGDILAARAMLDDLVSRDDPHALFAMAETYDPNILSAWNLPQANASADHAKALYKRARDRGRDDAAGRIAALE